MISTARQSPKFIRLVRRLRPLVGVGQIVDAESVAVSVLERLWHATAAGAIRGDIGRFDNEVIAELTGWLGDADQLIEILVECHWLDVSEEHRLLVHDWHQHAPNHVKGNAKKAGGFLTGQAPEAEPKGQAPEAEPQGTGAPILTNPNQSNPNQSREYDSPDGDTATTVEPRKVFDAWNERAAISPGVRSARDLTPDRAGKLRKRLSTASWPWREAIAKLPLPRGPDGNWQPDFDWLIKNDLNARKLADGAYDWRASSGKRQSAATGPGQVFDPQSSEVGF